MRKPWHGYGLGYWPDRWATAAERAVKGQYLETGRDYEKIRTEVSYYDDGIVIEPK